MVKALITVELKVMVEARDLAACEGVAPDIARDIWTCGDHIEFGAWHAYKTNEPGRVVGVEEIKVEC
jgi:hypothetical protein